MAHGVAADDETLARSRADGCVEIGYDFCRRPASAGCKRPFTAREVGAHLEAPSTEDVERRVIVLDQLEAPFAQSCNVFGDLLTDFWHRWIEYRSFTCEALVVRCVSGGLKRTDPHTGAGSDLPDVSGEAWHVREFFVATIPRAEPRFILSASGLPAVVDYDERPVLARWR